MVCGHFRNESFVGMNVFCVCSAPAKCHTVPISFMCIAKQRSSIALAVQWSESAGVVGCMLHCRFIVSLS